MPAFLLHEGAIVLCTHAGRAEPMTARPRVKAGGRAVTTLPGPYRVTGCVLLPVPARCLTALWVSAATRVTSGGVPVLLGSGRAICAPNGTNLMVLSTQLRVRGT